MQTNYLSRRNLLSLLSKLDRQLDGQETELTLVKYRSMSENFQQSMDACKVVAVENKEYYEALGRNPGDIHPLDVLVCQDKDSY